MKWKYCESDGSERAIIPTNDIEPIMLRVTRDGYGQFVWSVEVRIKSSSYVENGAKQEAERVGEIIKKALGEIR